MTSVEEYIERHANFTKELNLLRDIILKTELEENIKWGAPVYMLNKKNVLGINAFKHHFGIWFFNGVFLKNEKKLLTNAQDGKTKALRQMRFESIDEIDKNLVLAYVKEAIENQRLGKQLRPEKKRKAIVIPKELEIELDRNTALKSNFEALTNYKQREYGEYIESAKKEDTKQIRMEKIIPMILQGIGLNDKYKNC